MAVTTPQLFDPQDPQQQGGYQPPGSITQPPLGGTVNPVALPITGAPLGSTLGTPPPSGLDPVAMPISNPTPPPSALDPVAPQTMPFTQTPPPSTFDPVAPPPGSTLPGAGAAAMPIQSPAPTPQSNASAYLASYGYISPQDAVAKGLITADQIPSGGDYLYNTQGGGFSLQQNPISGMSNDPADAVPSAALPDPNSPIGTVWGQNVKTASGWENLGNFTARNEGLAAIGGRFGADPNATPETPDALTGMTKAQIESVLGGEHLRTVADDVNGMGTRDSEGNIVRFNPLGAAPQDVPLGAPGNPNPVPDAMPVQSGPAVTRQGDTTSPAPAPFTSTPAPSSRSTLQQMIQQIVSANGQPGSTDTAPPGRPAQPNATGVVASGGKAGGGIFDQLLTQIDPGNDLRSKQINPTNSPEATRARALAAKALEDSMGGPNRQDLASQAYDQFNEQDKVGYDEDLQRIYQLAGATGALGAGQTNRNLYSRFLDRQKTLADKKKSLGLEAAGQELNDRLNRLSAANSTSGQFAGEDLSGRNELRTERGYQSDQSQQAINNRLSQVLTEDQLKTSGANRSNATLSFLIDLANSGYDPVAALQNYAAQQSGEAGASSAAGANAFLSAAQQKAIEDYIKQHTGNAGANTSGGQPGSPGSGN